MVEKSAKACFKKYTPLSTFRLLKYIDRITCCIDILYLKLLSRLFVVLLNIFCESDVNCIEDVVMVLRVK